MFFLYNQPCPQITRVQDLEIPLHTIFDALAFIVTTTTILPMKLSRTKAIDYILLQLAVLGKWAATLSRHQNTGSPATVALAYNESLNRVYYGFNRSYYQDMKQAAADRRVMLKRI